MCFESRASQTEINDSIIFSIIRRTNLVTDGLPPIEYVV